MYLTVFFLSMCFSLNTGIKNHFIVQKWHNPLIFISALNFGMHYAYKASQK